MMSAPAEMARPRPVGVVGLGAMGEPIARHVLHRGSMSTVLVNSRRRESARRLEGEGATWCPTPAETAAQCDTILVVVPDIDDIRHVCLGPGGIQEGLNRPVTVVVHSTCSPVGLQELQKDCDALAGPGMIRMVDAPVSGGEEGAIAGTLSILVGGRDEDIARVTPVLELYGRTTVFGGLGAGQVAKACNQLVVASTIVGLAEAAVLAEGAGIDVRTMFEALSRGYAASRILESKRERFAAHDHSPSGAARFMVKDLAIARELLAAAEADDVHAEVLAQIFGATVERGWGDLDTAVVQKFVEGRSE